MWPVKIDPTKSDLAITAFAHNTSYAKFTITNYLARSVDNAINKYDYKNRLIYINDDLIEASINSKMSSAESLEKQLTSEHFINPVDKNGRVSPIRRTPMGIETQGDQTSHPSRIIRRTPMGIETF